MKITEIKKLLNSKTYDEMSDKELEIVSNYECDIFKKRMDKLKRTDNQKADWVHDLWKDYRMSDKTEDKLLSFLNY